MKIIATGKIFCSLLGQLHFFPKENFNAIPWDGNVTNMVSPPLLHIVFCSLHFLLWRVCCLSAILSSWGRLGLGLFVDLCLVFDVCTSQYEYTGWGGEWLACIERSLDDTSVSSGSGFWCSWPGRSAGVVGAVTKVYISSEPSILSYLWLLLSVSADSIDVGLLVLVLVSHSSVSISTSRCCVWYVAGISCDSGLWIAWSCIPAMIKKLRKGPYFIR